PLRTLDFLHALDSIVDSAISKKVDLVIFAGDAYRNQTPAPTFQREWGKRLLRLSKAGIFTIMVVGNHDLSPAVGRAHALQEFETLQIPNISVISKPCLLGPQDLNGLPLQVIGLPWVARSGLMAFMESQEKSLDAVNLELEDVISKLINIWLENLDPSLPTIFTGHITVQGALYGNERSVLLGRDLVISPGLLKDERFDYVALGHIHKFQDLNEGHYPPIVYPGSIERMDFGEINDKKGFVLADVGKGATTYTFQALEGRKFLSVDVDITEQEGINELISEKLPPKKVMKDAIFRLVLSYPRKWEALIDERAIREYAEDAFEFYLVRRPHAESRIRLPGTITLGQLPPLEILNLYWKSVHMEADQMEQLSRIAAEIIRAYEMAESVETLVEKLDQKGEEP
ncbi:MAG: exonuclease SbcCD subunit D, partial [Anaerolineaceae bacterium]